MSISELKLKAKELLNGKRKDAAIMLLVYWVIVGIIGGVVGAIFGSPYSKDATSTASVGQIVESLLLVFFTLGSTSYFLKISRREDVKLEELFSKGNIYIKAICISIITGVIIALGLIVFIIPGIILAIGYSMTIYILLDNNEVGITEALKQSREMMKGHKMDYFLLQLSFLGWIILSICTLGILFFWLVPYMEVTNANFYNSISGKNVEEVPVESETVSE